MSRIIPVKKNFYANGRTEGEIAMPPLDEKPPVLDATEWAGNNQPQQADPEPEVEEVQEAVDDEVIAEQAIEPEDHEEDEVQEKPKASGKTSSENMRILRERAEKSERERDELMRHVMSIQQQQAPKEKIAQPIEEIEPDLDLSVDDDALLEGKHAKKLIQKIKSMEKRLEGYQSRSQENSIEAKIKSELPDFDVVVNQQNIAQLNEEYPEIAATLRDTKDLYSKATAAYKIMKKFGIYKDRTYDTEKAVALKNAAKPRTVSSLNPQQGDSPLSKANAFANGLSKDLQAQLLKEMAQARKNL